jgi:transposase
MIPTETKVKIRRLFYVERWKIGTIATQLGVHPDTVRLAIESDMFRHASTRNRTKLTDPYMNFIEETIKEYPRLRVSRLHQMLKGRGYEGSLTQLRRVVTTIRPRIVEAYLRLETFPGEQSQADWASFGRVPVAGGKRNLSCFVITLSYSRALYFEFFFDQRLESLLLGQVHAFREWEGVSRTILFDNLASVVVDRRGDLIQFHPRILDLAGHYHFAPLPCHPGRGNEKGRVERAIRYIRESFFAARKFTTLLELNRQAKIWRDEVANLRRHPEQNEKTVREVFEEEKPRLLPLPEHDLESDLLQPIRSGKTIYIRFDTNDYSIPPEAVGRQLTLVASPTTIRLLDGSTEIARHVRSYDCRQRICNPAHIEALLIQKKKALSATAGGRLKTLIPAAEQFLDAAFQRGESIGKLTQQLLTLIDLYGTEEVANAVDEACQKGTPRINSINYILSRRRRNQRRSPASVDLSRHPHVSDLAVPTHNLEDYDELTHDDQDDNK